MNLAKWLYRDRRPNWVETVFNKRWVAVHALGVAPYYLVTLEAPGRRSGRRISLPLITIIVEGMRYLVLRPRRRWRWPRLDLRRPDTRLRRTSTTMPLLW